MDIKELFIESVTENKKLIIGLYALFIIIFIASWILNASKAGAVAGNITAINGSPIGGETSPIELFIKNEGGGILTYIGSVFFGIFAVATVIVNGYSMGSIGSVFASVIPNGGIMYVIYLIPHGIFEITGMIIQSAAGILLFLFIWRFIKAWRSSESENASDAFEMTKKTLIQSLMLTVIAFILTLIAAPIEAYISVPFSQFIMGILGLV